MTHTTKMKFVFTLKGLDGLDWDVTLEAHECEVGIVFSSNDGQRLSMDSPMMTPDLTRQLAIALIEIAAVAEEQIAEEVHET
jgi:hypothetical protein